MEMREDFLREKTGKLCWELWPFEEKSNFCVDAKIEKVCRFTAYPAASPSLMQPVLRLKPQAQANLKILASSQNENLNQRLYVWKTLQPQRGGH